MKALFLRAVLSFTLVLIPIFLQAQSPSKSSKRLGSLELSEKVIKQRIELFVLKNYKENHAEVELGFKSLPVPVRVDPLDWDIKVDSRYGRIRNGANILDITILSRTNIYKKFVTTVRVRTFDKIVVAASRLNKHQKITEEHLELRTMETTNLKRKYFKAMADVLDLQTKRIVPEGKPLFIDMVELPDVIHRGDVVRLVVKLKNLQVTATAKALENGRLGENIMVENLGTGKKLTGLIENEKTVVVEL